uniref:hypothetical protein n=1 Tax=Escherichia coli TaxID=562 RepID=UPI00196789A6
LLNWLNSVFTTIKELSVPLARPLDISQYLGVFGYLGPFWISFITTACALAFIYVVSYLVVSQRGLIIKFKDMIKWW